MPISTIDYLTIYYFFKGQTEILNHIKLFLLCNCMLLKKQIFLQKLIKLLPEASTDDPLPLGGNAMQCNAMHGYVEFSKKGSNISVILGSIN